uniref:Uncharacterized protein n=1 Tax=Kalanchoe fedtschenkoi TaxID=63787 RepID=A0A7N0TA36_KALFE
MFAKVALSILLLGCLFSQGMGQCSVQNLKITTAPTGTVANGKPVYNVTVTNACACGQSSVVIDCTGLQSAVPLDLAHVTKVDATKCLLNNGDIIYPKESTSFTYAWNQVFTFKPVDSQVSCS